MKKRPEGAPVQLFTLRNSEGQDLRFEGWKLAEISTWNPDSKSRGDRWKERAVYETKAGHIIAHKLGRSRFAGEVDRGQVLVIRKPTAQQAMSERSMEATQPMGFMEYIAGVKPDWADAQLLDWFRDDSLAKDLFEQLGLDDVELID